MSEDCKSVIQHWIEELNKGNLDIMDELFHPDFFDHNPLDGNPPTKEGYTSLVKMAHSGMPGYQVIVDDIISERDKVVVRVSIEGKHTNELLGLPASGKDVAWSGIGIYRIQDKKIIERWEIVDSLKMSQELGAIPT